MIELTHVPAPLQETWETLFELAEQYPDGWSLIGAQMVALHAAEHGRVPPRSSEDADVLANARLLQPRPRHIAQALLARDFTLAGVSATEAAASLLMFWRPRG